jgi:hypothetical protein
LKKLILAGTRPRPRVTAKQRACCHAFGGTTGGAGWPSAQEIPASIDAREGALLVQIVIMGIAISRLSSVPARTVIR